MNEDKTTESKTPSIVVYFEDAIWENIVTLNLDDFVSRVLEKEGYRVSHTDMTYRQINYLDNSGLLGSGRFIENVLAGSAQFDNEVRAERSKNGMVDAVKDGRWVWKAPFGYKNVKVEGRKNIAPVDSRVTIELIQEAWRLIDNGYSETQALKIVTADGLRNGNGKPITIQHFSKMLRNKLYMGEIEAFGMTISSKSIKPVIEEGLWIRVYEHLTGRNKAPARNTKLNPKYPRRGVLRCLNGHRMTGSSPRGNGGRYPKYHCPKCRGKGYSFDVSSTDFQFVE
jgi:hypothetical protein